MVKLQKIFPLILISFLCFSSCEEPDDPALPYESSVTKSIGRTITSIDILWEQAQLDNFDRYEIYYKKFYETDYKLYISTTNQNQLYATVSGLTPDTEYKIYINTIDKNGKVYTSKEITERTFSDVPMAFSEFVISDYSFNYAILRWSAYKDSYAVPFDRYELYVGKTLDFVCNDSSRSLIIYNMDTYEATIGGLGDKLGYYFKMRVYNKIGKYRESISAFLRTPNAPPKPVILYEAENITESSATIRWQKSTDPEFEKYTIHVSDNVDFTPSAKNLLTIIRDAKDTSIQVTGLKTGNPYVYKVMLYDQYLDYSVSNYVGFNAYKDGIPPPSEIVYMTPNSQKSEITVVWEESDLKQFVRYDIYKSTDSLDLVANKGLSHTSDVQFKTNYIFTDMKRDTKYYFKVAVVNIFAKQSHSKIQSIYLP